MLTALLQTRFMLFCLTKRLSGRWKQLLFLAEFD